MPEVLANMAQTKGATSGEAHTMQQTPTKNKNGSPLKGQTISEQTH